MDPKLSEVFKVVSNCPVYARRLAVQAHAALPSRLGVLATWQISSIPRDVEVELRVLLSAVLVFERSFSETIMCNKVCYMIFFGVNLNLASIETMTPLLAQRSGHSTSLACLRERLGLAQLRCAHKTFLGNYQYQKC